MCVQLFLAQHIITCEICQASVHQEANLQTYTTTEKTNKNGSRRRENFKSNKEKQESLLEHFYFTSYHYYFNRIFFRKYVNISLFISQEKKKAVCFEGL